MVKKTHQAEESTTDGRQLKIRGRGKVIDAKQTTESPPKPGLGQSVIAQMRQKLKTVNGSAVYKQRKVIVEPVFGQIKEVRGFRRFSFRGLEKNTAEWITGISDSQLCRKLFRVKAYLLPA
ncbi:MAG: transposase [Gemmatimonadaceae bacterium]